jgi:hypothetical protein
MVVGEVSGALPRVGADEASGALARVGTGGRAVCAHTTTCAEQARLNSFWSGPSRWETYLHRGAPGVTRYLWFWSAESESMPVVILRSNWPCRVAATATVVVSGVCAKTEGPNRDESQVKAGTAFILPLNAGRPAGAYTHLCDPEPLRRRAETCWGGHPTFARLDADHTVRCTTATRHLSKGTPLLPEFCRQRQHFRCIVWLHVNSAKVGFLPGLASRAPRLNACGAV